MRLISMLAACRFSLYIRVDQERIIKKISKFPQSRAVRYAHSARLRKPVGICFANSGTF